MEPTEKQLNCISFIERYTFFEFEGNTKGEASKFIHDHINSANKGKHLREKQREANRILISQNKERYHLQYMDDDLRMEDYGLFY